MNLMFQRLSWPARLGLTAVLVVGAAATVVLSAVFFALFVVLGIVASGWLWWQGRRLRQHTRKQYVEAEYEVITETELLEDHHERAGYSSPYTERHNTLH